MVLVQQDFAISRRDFRITSSGPRSRYWIIDKQMNLEESIINNQPSLRLVMF